MLKACKCFTMLHKPFRTVNPRKPEACAAYFVRVYKKMHIFLKI